MLRNTPWLLGTRAILKVQHEFLKQCHSYVGVMQNAYPVLENFVHVDNRASIRWLRWCGFTIDKEVPEVINDEDFYRFYME